MTHHTDAERAELLQDAQAAGFGRIVDGVAGLPPAWWGQDISALEAFDKLRAARRAPAAPVPQGWKWVPIEPTPEIISASDDISGRGDGADHWAAMLAAAPQPPEGLKRENPATKPEAAPVELPEPVAKIEGGSLKWHIPDTGYSLPVRYLQGTENLYTEHQVRQLLSAREQST